MLLRFYKIKTGLTSPSSICFYRWP